MLKVNNFEHFFESIENIFNNEGVVGGKGGNGVSIKEPSSAGPSSPRACSSASSTVSVLDDHHWSKDDKYDADSYLEINYKKHLTRHANK